MGIGAPGEGENGSKDNRCPVPPPAPTVPQAAQGVRASAAPPEKGGASGFSIDNAVYVLNANANERSVHACGRYVGLALQAGGIKGAMADAKDYGPILLKNGFVVVSTIGYFPRMGDVTVVDGNATHKWGRVHFPPKLKHKLNQQRGGC